MKFSQGLILFYFIFVFQIQDLFGLFEAGMFLTLGNSWEPLLGLNRSGSTPKIKPESEL